MTLLTTSWGSPAFARSMQRSTEGSTSAVSSIWRYPAWAAAAADSKSASSLAFTCVIICGMITSWPLANMDPRHRRRQKPPSLERVAEAVAPAVYHSHPVDIKVEDTGMPVSERARYRRFPDAGRPVQVDESYHLRDATFGSSPVLLIGAEFLPGKIRAAARRCP